MCSGTPLFPLPVAVVGDLNTVVYVPERLCHTALAEAGSGPYGPRCFDRINTEDGLWHAAKY